MQHPLRSSAGFTYVTAIVMVVLMGIILSKGAQVWSMKMQREREVELIFRGTQVRDALRRWYKLPVPVSGYVPQTATPATGQTTSTGIDAAAAGIVQSGGIATLKLPSPQDLKTLLSGTATAAKAHYLRPSNLIDPITGKEWAVVKDASQRIVGVSSTSEAVPLKQANFPFDLDPADFEGKKKYSEWQFICNKYPKPGATGGGISGLKTTGSPATQSPTSQSPTSTGSP